MFRVISRSRLAVLGALALLAALASAFYLNTGTPITLQADGVTRSVRVRAATVGAALREAGLSLYPEDVVQPAPDAPLSRNLVIAVDRAAVVRVDVAGQTRTVRTQLTEPLALLNAIGLNLAPGDEVWADGVRLAEGDAPRLAAPAEIVLRRAFTVTITDGQASAQIQTAARTVGEALWGAGYRLYREDQTSPALHAPAAPLMSIVIERARPVTLQADGRSLRTRTRRATVGEVLDDLGVALVGEDYALPAPDQPLPADGLLRVVRVRTDVITEQAVIPFETLYQAQPEVEIDNVSTLQAGVNGLKRRRTLIRYEDGVEVGRVAEGETVVQNPVPRLLGYGTNIVVRTLDTPDGPLEYWRSLTMYATSYSPARAGTPPTARWYGITASGKPLTKGLVAVDRRFIPFGTRMYVPGYGFAEAADTGGGVRGRWIDLGYDDANYVSWHQVVTVYFVAPIPPADQIVWLMPSTVP
jgi:uncharacterized protein YabE (DUF348 family)